MAIDRADVIEAELFKHGRGYKHAFGVLFKPFGEFQHRGCAFEQFLQFITRVVDEITTQQFRQITVHRAHRG